jgi:hypothetical protein
MDASVDRSAREMGGPLVSVSAALRRWTAASVVLHLCVLGALLYVRSPQLTTVERPGDASGRTRRGLARRRQRYRRGRHQRGRPSPLRACQRLRQNNR